MAVQHELGVLPERSARPGSGYPSDNAPDRPASCVIGLLPGS